MQNTSWVRSPLFNFVGGVLAGGCLAASAAVHTLTVRVEAANRDATSANEARLAAITDHWRAELAAAETHAKQCDAALVDELRREDAAGKARDFRDSWYTLVYEPGSVPDNAAPLDLLNLMRPGLGTALAKFQPPAQSGAQLRYVLRGYVEPAVPLSPSVHFVHTLDPSIATQGVQ